MRTSKISRLPRKIRHQLNHRLADGQPAETVLPWLNALPAVKSMLTANFDGQPISKQNLSQWRTGGFAAWETRQDLLADALDLAEDSTDLTAATRAQLPEHLATILAARYASLMLHWDGEESVIFPRKLRLLQPLCQAVAQLRRGQNQADRLQLEKDRLVSRKKQTDAEIMDQFEIWSRKTEVRDAIFRKWRSPAERKRDFWKLIWGEGRPVPAHFTDDDDEYETHHDEDAPRPEESERPAAAKEHDPSVIGIWDHPGDQDTGAADGRADLPVNQGEDGSSLVKASQDKKSEPAMQTTASEPVTTENEKQDVPAATPPAPKPRHPNGLDQAPPSTNEWIVKEWGRTSPGVPVPQPHQRSCISAIKMAIPNKTDTSLRGCDASSQSVPATPSSRVVGRDRRAATSPPSEVEAEPHVSGPRPRPRENTRPACGFSRPREKPARTETAQASVSKSRELQHAPPLGAPASCRRVPSSHISVLARIARRHHRRAKSSRNRAHRVRTRWDERNTVALRCAGRRVRRSAASLPWTVPSIRYFGLSTFLLLGLTGMAYFNN